MILRNALFAIMCAVVACTTVVVQAAPVFYVSTLDVGATPGLLDLDNVALNSTGTLHIWANSDVRLSGVSLDLLETGGGIKFTSLNVPNPSTRWAFLDGPQVIGDSAVTSIGGGAIPGAVGNGVGVGSPEGASVLIASVGFTAGAAPGASQLSLRVGTNTIRDWDGIGPPVHFGTMAAASVPGDVPGGMASVGSIMVGEGGVVVPPIAADFDAGNLIRGGVLNHSFTTTAGTPPITWGNLVATGPGGASPGIAPVLNADGTFSWNSGFSAFGTWTFDATADNTAAGAGGGTDVGRLTVNIIVPEPATMSLLGLAMIGLVGYFGRRSR